MSAGTLPLAAFRTCSLAAIKRIPEDFAGALGAIEKPYTINGMKNALDYISSIVAGDEDVTPPVSLVLAEDWEAILVRRNR